MNASAVPGMVIDSRGEIVIVLMSDDAIGVSIMRFSTMPAPESLLGVIDRERWVAVYRTLGNRVFLVNRTPHPETEPTRLATAQENESGQFAIELALSAWPEWGSSYRQTFKQRAFIPYRTAEADA